MTKGGSRRGGRVKLSVDSDSLGLRGNVPFRLARRRVVVTLHKVAFSS